ncbi:MULTISPECIES: cell wall metabolism sensor histidine kinase WalK [Bacillaceae]|uniref:cell wall metabolism sensor histidine kinase WalK n=1 Tax=Bacillaceae TaxID=186817 RepID=UPI002A0E702A|nr:cell wall metabolism sensor histidine kinase WalK [Cytobacillus sp. IB215316]MDX8360939.1 cell wall metabolism sensor histidine kinase WalK [Cytobacillus sp. IB215316]
MKKVGVFRSIHIKFILIYILLILIAMQIIGVYFVRKLEGQLVEGFKVSLDRQENILSYYLEEAITLERDEQASTVEDDVKNILRDYDYQDIIEVRVIDINSRVIGTSNPDNEKIVGKRMTERGINLALIVGTASDELVIEPNTGFRLRVLSTPIKSNDEIVGAIYLVASMENVYNQMKQINRILVTGTVLAMVITAVLGIFLAHTITRPISDMRKQALAMAKGNFSRKVRIYGYDEIGQLALTFNYLSRKLQEAQASTEGERRKLASVITHMTDGVIATDRTGHIILINDPALKLLGISREDVFNKPIISALGLEDELNFDTLLNERESLILDVSTKDNSYILRVNFSVIENKIGITNGLIAVLHDVTEQEKIEQERREFVANVSHELRTPLTTMRSYLEALAEGAWQDKDIAPQFLHVTQTETERMIRLVKDLLQLSKLDSRDYSLHRTPVNFIEFFHQIIDRFEISKNQYVTFKRQLPDEKITVSIDKDKVTQVIDNIISNALKYSPEGGQVSFSLRKNVNHLEVIISDEGVGIPKANLAHIFDRFYRVDKARSRNLGGTGLGLAISKEMIEAHGGDIWAESEEGKGTTIFFTLPLEKEQEDEWS